MNQAGHIFAKDMRHLRWEIGISLVLTAAYVVVAPSEWKPPMQAGSEAIVNGELRFLAAILSLLVGVSWWLLITRVVQSESLVGDRQWWITKPYEWRHLLSAKLLFVGAFILLPIALAKGATLAEGGFAVSGHFVGLGYGLVAFAAYLLVPLFAIAAITSTFARTTLTILGVVVAFIAIEAVVAIAVMSGFTVSWITWIVLAILLSAGAAGIGLQYARRATWTTRAILAGGVLLVSVALACAGNSGLIAMSYPQAATAPLQLSYRPETGSTNYSQWANRKVIGIGIPVQASGIAAGTAVNLDAVQMMAEAADGRRWKSGWNSLWGTRYRPDSDPNTAAPLPVQFESSFVQAEQGNLVTLHLRLAATTLRASAPVQFAMPAHEFTVPGFGICVPEDPIAVGDYTGLHCRNALRQPAAAFVEVQWSNAPCEMPGASSGVTITGQTWTGDLKSDPANLRINSVEEVPLQLSNGEQLLNGRNVPRYLCPGSLMTFTSYTLEKRVEYDVTFANYRMPAMPAGSRAN